MPVVQTDPDGVIYEENLQHEARFLPRVLVAIESRFDCHSGQSDGEGEDVRHLGTGAVSARNEKSVEERIVERGRISGPDSFTAFFVPPSPSGAN